MDPFDTDNEQRSHSELEAAIESLNRVTSNKGSESQEASGTDVNVISRIEWIETELIQQKRNFENVDRRFDDLSQQIAALLTAMASTAEQTSTPTPTAVAAEHQPASEIHGFHLSDVVPIETGIDHQQNNNILCESVAQPLMESNQDLNRQPSEVRTQGTVSLDGLLARLSAVDTGHECDVEEAPQPDAGLELESTQPEKISTDVAIEQQQRKLEELFASLRIREEELPAEDSLSSNQAVATLSDNRLELEQPQESQFGSAVAEPSEFEPGPATDLTPRLQSLPELDEAATFDQEIQVPDLNVALEEPAAAKVAVTLPEATVSTSIASMLAEHVDGTDVQDYMKSLLQRLKGGEPAKQPAASTAVKIVTPPRALTETPDNPNLQSETDRLKTDEFLPKRVAPEKNANMSAMRELANASSRSAVKSSELRRQKANSKLQLLLAGGGIIGAAFTSALSQSRGDLFFYFSICLLVVSLACICFYAHAQMLVQHKEAGDSNTEPLVGETTGFDWSKLKEFTTVIMSKLNRSPKESS